MAYNLIDERWIPIERKSGRKEMISPAQLVEREDPPLRVASARPDFDGALLEFLVGLLQTASAPANEREWRKAFESPPPVATLQKRLASIREAFFLDGDGPRFMQDLTVAKDRKASRLPVGALLIDRVGEAGLAEAPTLFAKPGGFEAFGYPTVAAALMALQTYAPAGGRGQLTSLRGGGPLTTLVAADGLWETVWLNVLPRPDFEELTPGTPSKDAVGATFPWMAPTRSGKGTNPTSVHPLQHFWGLPRRVRLEIQSDDLSTCSVTEEPLGPVVRTYVGRPDGTNYEGDFRHPLTPYAEVKPREPWNPKKGSADGFSYRDWPRLVTVGPKRSPAAVVSHFTRSRRADCVRQPRLLVFGYAMDNMKPLRWCRAETPLVTVAPERADGFATEVDALVAVSEDVRKTLSFQLKSAWSDRPKDLDVFDRVNPAFWDATEPAFFEAVHSLRRQLEAPDGSAWRDPVREEWLGALHEAALRLFDGFVDTAAALAPPDLRRAVLARRELVAFTRPTAPKLRKLLGLLVDEPSEKQRGRGPRMPRKETSP